MAFLLSFHLDGFVYERCYTRGGNGGLRAAESINDEAEAAGKHGLEQANSIFLSSLIPVEIIHINCLSADSFSQLAACVTDRTVTRGKFFTSRQSWFVGESLTPNTDSEIQNENFSDTYPYDPL